MEKTRYQKQKKVRGMLFGVLILIVSCNNQGPTSLEKNQASDFLKTADKDQNPQERKKEYEVLTPMQSAEIKRIECVRDLSLKETSDGQRMEEFKACYADYFESTLSFLCEDRKKKIQMISGLISELEKTSQVSALLELALNEFSPPLVPFSLSNNSFTLTVSVPSMHEAEEERLECVRTLSSLEGTSLELLEKIKTCYTKYFEKTTTSVCEEKDIMKQKLMSFFVLKLQEQPQEIALKEPPLPLPPVTLSDENSKMKIVIKEAEARRSQCSSDITNSPRKSYSDRLESLNQCYIEYFESAMAPVCEEKRFMEEVLKNLNLQYQESGENLISKYASNEQEAKNLKSRFEIAIDDIIADFFYKDDDVREVAEIRFDIEFMEAEMKFIQAKEVKQALLILITDNALSSTRNGFLNSPGTIKDLSDEQVKLLEHFINLYYKLANQPCLPLA